MTAASVSTPFRTKNNVNVDRFPDLCPVCLHSVQPLQIAEGVSSWTPDSSSILVLQLPFRCPRQDCSNLFIAQYVDTFANGLYVLSKLMPRTVKPVHFEEPIASVSPGFIKIFNQANTAEGCNLDEIAGVGFRKALEFLIKDYCIQRNAEKSEEIKKAFLGNCIKTFVTDTNVKRCAERATWLGNDETHYVRIWNEHDIQDLKRLVKLTVNWISNEILTDQYFSSMSPK